MRVLVFGAAGYLGHRLVKRLRQQDVEVIGADVRPNPELAEIQLDIRFHDEVQSVVAKVRPNILINLAALRTAATSVNPVEGLRVNVEGLNAIFAAAATTRSVHRVVHASSISVYGLQFSGSALTEDSPRQPRTLYDWTKSFGEVLGRQYGSWSRLQVLTLRLSNNYGYERSSDHPTPVSILLSGAKDGAAALPYPRDHVMSLIHIDDSTQMLVRLALAESARSAVYNTGGDTISMGELAAVAQSLLGISVTFGERGSASRYSARISGDRIRSELGLRPRTVEQGLRSEATRLGLSLHPTD